MVAPARGAACVWSFLVTENKKPAVIAGQCAGLLADDRRVFLTERSGLLATLCDGAAVRGLSG